MRLGNECNTWHWLCDAATLRPHGQLAYPMPVGAFIAPLPDGTWLTDDGTRLHRWRL